MRSILCLHDPALRGHLINVFDFAAQARYNGKQCKVLVLGTLSCDPCYEDSDNKVFAITQG